MSLSCCWEIKKNCVSNNAQTRSLTWLIPTKKVLGSHKLCQCGGNVLCILLLDNCSAHMVPNDAYPDKIMLYFLPPGVTSKHQPADMGMIAALKVGYRMKMLDSLLAIFDVDGGYASAATTRGLQKAGCRGLAYGGKATVLDAIDILHGIWDGDNKYARKESIGRCWRKAEILPLSWNVEINNNVGSNSLSTNDKQVTIEQCAELCSLFEAIRVKVCCSSRSAFT